MVLNFALCANFPHLRIEIWGTQLQKPMQVSRLRACGASLEMTPYKKLTLEMTPH